MLSPLKILVTRPTPQGEILSKRIIAAGGQALHVPTIQIVSLTDTPRCQINLSHLSQYDWLIFTSLHAVTLSAPWLCKLNEQVKVAAIGQTTAQALQSLGISSLFPPTQWCSEGLLALEPFKAIVGKKIALLQGENPRLLLADILQTRGAMIQKIFLYRRQLADVSLAVIKKCQQVNVILTTSKAILLNLNKILKSNRLDFYQTPVVVVNAETQALAKKIGFESILVAKNPSDDAMMTLLEEKKDWLC